jgi:low affinity Fe/Cu permease
MVTHKSRTVEVFILDSENGKMPKPTREKGGSAGWFNHFAVSAARIVGSPYAFMVAITTVVVWFVAGPYFHWSNAWQLVINSVTNIVTYLVVFVIQNSQNRDSEAMNLKLNELIASSRYASNELINVEDLSDADLNKLFRRYERIREEWDRRRM